MLEDDAVEQMVKIASAGDRGLNAPTRELFRRLLRSGKVWLVTESFDHGDAERVTLIMRTDQP
jgi:hypothetical protein